MVNHIGQLRTGNFGGKRAFWGMGSIANVDGSRG